MKTVITFGTFDVFHIGHLNIIKQARELGDRLVVGVSTDKLTFAKKGRNPVYCEQHRLEIVANIVGVDEVFYEESLEWKRKYLQKYNADILVMGDDWRGKFDMFNDICEVVYPPRTKNISTTELIDSIKSLP